MKKHKHKYKHKHICTNAEVVEKEQRPYEGNAEVRAMQKWGQRSSEGNAVEQTKKNRNDRIADKIREAERIKEKK